MDERIIGHIDMDAFFASVEERDKPYLKGLPVIVGSDPQEGKGRGVVSTANYQARALGIGSALPISTAWKLCEESRVQGGPRCVFITSGFERYSAASEDVFCVVRRHVTILAQTSIDEAYLDLSFCGSYQKAQELAVVLKAEVKRHTGLTCSIGIGPNKMIAKIASDHEKPDGLTVVPPDKVADFLEPLPIRALPGIGNVSAQTFTHRGIKTIRDAQKYSWEELAKLFGQSGFSLWERIRGIDERPVSSEKAASKSIGKNHTFSTDTHDIKEVTTVAHRQVQHIIEGMHTQGFRNFRTVVLTIRFSNFITHTRSLTLDAPIRTQKDLELKVLKLLLPFFEKTENPNGLAVRLVGVRVEKLA